jgi:hypothetical protein
MEMVAAQAHHRQDADDGDEDMIAMDESMTDDEKRDALQKALNRAASNGDVARIRKLVNGKAKSYVDVNLPDEEGTVPLVYSSCFGHKETVAELLNAGAQVDKQDRNGWSSLMWSITNSHKEISKLLLDHGASPDIRSTSGGTAYDFVQPGSDFSQYLADSGYYIGSGVNGDSDFYQTGMDDELAMENEMKRRMLVQESAANLEVDLGSLGFGEQPESPTDSDEEEFIWDRCVGDQMYVFVSDKLDPILDLIITNMVPQRSISQKPVPANMIFLMARYAHYHMTNSLLEELLEKAIDRINDVIERFQWDMSMLAFWISNETLLLHYLRKDAGLMQSTTKYQQEIAELINETYVLITRDAERRLNKFMEAAMLDHETIPGFDTIEFQGEFSLFKSKSKPVDDPGIRPPSPKRRAQTSPRNITSLLSSVLFVLDLYDVHSVITAQIMAQLLYWIGSELFNRLINNRRYLSRTKSMNIRMNVSQLEDFARANNRQPEHFEGGSTKASGEDTIAAARRHLAPMVQLLQWLQCFSSLPDDHDALINTLIQLQRLTPAQLIHAVKNYRYEVGEKSMAKQHMKWLQGLLKGQNTLIARPLTPVRSEANTPTPEAQNQNGKPATPARKSADGRAQPDASAATPTSATTSNATPTTPSNPTPTTPAPSVTIDPPPHSADATSPAPSTTDLAPSTLLLDQSAMLPFYLPTSTDMLITYGAGIGGVDRERARKYVPTVPTDVLSRLEDGAGVSSPGPKKGRGRGDSVGTVGTVATIAGGWRS